MKRFLDIIGSFLGLVMFSPLILLAMLFIWLQDWHSPLYIANRVGRNNKSFRMVKLRSMVINADKFGIDSTSNNDNRITLIGKIIRKSKLDEITQLWNVLLGNMSFVGPRPNVERETNLYTNVEKKLLSVKPGITDFSSIVFADEGSILADKSDPDLAYNQIIRPWKSRLGIIYIENSSIVLDIKLVIFTLISAFSRDMALGLVAKELTFIGADQDLIDIASRKVKLTPLPPPGALEVVQER
jgi:lipopolysaccharide/colanic/teichoic acid biosynthesis glycosyltransferase